jgi:hypothetical protein
MHERLGACSRREKNIPSPYSSQDHSGPIHASSSSRALPWFESYADQDRTIRMFLRNAGNEEAMMAPDMIGFMESVV